MLLHTFTWIWAKIAYLHQLSNGLQCNRNELKTIMGSACCYWPSGIAIIMESPPRENRTLWYCPEKYQQLHCEYSVTFHLLGYTNSQLFGTRLYLVTRFGARILPRSVLSCTLGKKRGAQHCSSVSSLLSSIFVPGMEV